MKKYGEINLRIIQERRKYMGLTQKDVAEKLNISHQAYSALESGDRKLSLERAAQIADLLNLHLGDFFLKTNSTKWRVVMLMLYLIEERKKKGV